MKSWKKHREFRDILAFAKPEETLRHTKAFFHSLRRLQPRRGSSFLTLSLLAFTLIFSTTGRASASPAADVTNDHATLDFPNAVTFQAQINSTAEITSVVLEYGDQEETCGQVIAKAYPQFTPGNTVNVAWTWDMRQPGSLPPRAQIWQCWRHSDK